MRNILVHDYESVDLDVVWDVVENELSALRSKIKKLLNQADGGEPGQWAEPREPEAWSAVRWISIRAPPAERLIYYFSHPETCRRFSNGDPPMDFMKAAFAIALDEDFDQEELDKLGRWREEVRDRSEDDAPPTGD